MSSWREVGALLIDCDDDPRFNVVVSTTSSADITAVLLTSSAQLITHTAPSDVLDDFMSDVCVKLS